MKLQQKEQQRQQADEENEEEEEEEEREADADDSTTVAVVWGERCGLEVWRCSHVNSVKFQPFYHICSEVRLSV